jgi:hypothetical protein
MARDDVAQRGARMDTKEKYARSMHEEKKRRWKNKKGYGHDAHRHCKLPIKRRGATISNMEITNMKGGRISKYENH